MKYLTCIFFFISYALFAQNNKKVDSLLQILKTAKHDTTRYNAYLDLGNYFQNINPDTAIYFHTQAEKIAEKIPGAEGELRKSEAIRQKGWCEYMKGNYDEAIRKYNQSLKIVEKYLSTTDKKIVIQAHKLQSSNFGNIGAVYYNQGNHVQALEYYSKALKIDEKLGNKNGQARHLGNIGIIYMEQGDYARALEYFFKTLKFFEEIGNKRNQAINLGNIGIVYTEQGDYARALEYFFKALKMNEELGNTSSQGRDLTNIGNVYNEQKNYARALEYYFKALKISEKIGDKKGQDINLGNIGVVYMKQGDYARALEYFFKSLKISKETGDKRSQAINLSYIGTLYIQQKKYKEAEAYLKKAEQMHREMHTIYHLKDACSGLSELYEKTGRYKEALYYHKEYIKARDTVLNEENRKASIVKDMKYKYEKEQALKEQEHQKQLAIEKEKKEKQKLISYAIAAGLVLVAAFSVILFNRLQITRKQKHIIETQKQIVEAQKKLVEEKNKEITDSILYAKRIQNAILPHSAKWKQNLPNSFILYLPKDIVAGDFYWMEILDKYIYVAAADCTGHGVPGAMVSVVCSSALTKTVLEEKITETDKILNRVREIVVEKLSSGEEHIRDGMDVCLVRLEKNTNKIQYSGANRSLYIVQNGEIQELKPDKQPIGRYEESQPFTKQEVELSQGSKIYLTTDGYADQFGGEKGKKLSTKKFAEKIKEFSQYLITEQGEKFKEFYTTWKGDNSQLDDVTVIGIEV